MKPPGVAHCGDGAATVTIDLADPPDVTGSHAVPITLAFRMPLSTADAPESGREGYVMGFSDGTKDEAYARAGARCECTREGHGHDGHRCETRVKRRGKSVHYHHKTARKRGGSDALSNSEVLCQPCHVLTKTYGKH